MKLVEYLNDIDNIEILDVFYKQVPYGYDTSKRNADGSYEVKTVRKKVVEVLVKGNDISFLNYLSEKLVIQIGDTFYRKNGAGFVYEYLNQSNDYEDNLYEAEMRVYIMFNGGLLGT